jgi:nicotinamide-nucleotide amidase
MAFFTNLLDSYEIGTTLVGAHDPSSNSLNVTACGINAGMSDSLEQILGNMLHSRGLKIATAESCTGGLVSDHITDIPGSSDYFVGGVVAYAYEAKVALLHVSWDTLRLYGAVSRETVIEMARGVRTILGADIGISVSGVAGPGGGIREKPVGMTCP